MDKQPGQLLWRPSPERIGETNMTAFMVTAGKRWGRDVADYASLHRWSVERPEEFWLSVWEFCKQ